MAPLSLDHVDRMSTARVEALSDGIYAVIMTLLIFDIKVPQVAPADLPAALLLLWPNLLGYAISFVVLGVYWVGHRTQFNVVRRADRVFHWINIVFFAVSALVPFSTGLMSRYPFDRWALTIYAANLSLIGLVLFWQWSYATGRQRLTDADLSPQVVQYGRLRCLLTPVGYTLSIGLVFINPLAALVAFVVLPLFYIFPALDRYWARGMVEHR